jgi:hypothetical protein
VFVRIGVGVFDAAGKTEQRCGERSVVAPLERWPLVLLGARQLVAVGRSVQRAGATQPQHNDGQQQPPK